MAVESFVLTCGSEWRTKELGYKPRTIFLHFCSVMILSFRRKKKKLLFSYSFNGVRAFWFVLLCLLFVRNTTLHIHKGIQIINWCLEIWKTTVISFLLQVDKSHRYRKCTPEETNVSFSLLQTIFLTTWHLLNKMLAIECFKRHFIRLHNSDYLLCLSEVFVASR